MTIGAGYSDLTREKSSIHERGIGRSILDFKVGQLATVQTPFEATS